MNRLLVAIMSGLLYLPLAAPPAVAGNDLLKQLSGKNDSADELLPPDQAFTVAVTVRDAHSLVATFTPAPGYFLYREKFAFRVLTPPDIRMASVELPRGEIKDDPFFGKSEIFHVPVQAVVKLERGKNAAARDFTLHLKYQGCNEPLGVCYLPIEKELGARLPALAPR